MKSPRNSIPEGCYCYDYGKTGKIKICPFWEIRYGKAYQNNGYCKFLKRGDWQTQNGLLWDQVKECGINNYYYDYD